MAEPLLDELVREFDKLKRHYMRSKGMDVPPTPTAQLEIMPEEELIVADAVSDIPVPAETRKKTTEKELILQQITIIERLGSIIPRSFKNNHQISQLRIILKLIEKHLLEL